MPLLFICYLVASIDRINISFAASGGMLKDLGLNATEFGFAARKKPAGKAAPWAPQLGDKVTIPNSPLVWTILTPTPDGRATLTYDNTNLSRFRVPVSDMKPAN